MEGNPGGESPPLERRSAPASRAFPLWSLRVLRLAEFWVVVVSVGLLLRGFSKATHGKALVQAAVLACILTTVALLPPVRSLFRKLPPIHRALVLLLVGLAIIAQLSARVHYTFPFVAWTMYSIPPKPLDIASHYELLGRGEDGSPRRVTPEEVFPGAHMRMYVKLSRLVASATAQGATEAEIADLTETLLGLARAYNDSAPAAGPIRSLEVRQCRFQITDYQRRVATGDVAPWHEDLLERETVWKVEIGEGS
jgi:hypothetical protein